MSTPNTGARTPWGAAFAHEVKKLRTEAGMSQTELANRLRAAGIPFQPQMIKRIEDGTREIRLDEAIVLADIFRRPLHDMTNAAFDWESAKNHAEADLWRADEQARKSIEQTGQAWNDLAAALDSCEIRLNAARGYAGADHAEELQALAEHVELLQWTADHIHAAWMAMTDGDLEPVIGDPARLKA